MSFPQLWNSTAFDAYGGTSNYTLSCTAAFGSYPPAGSIIFAFADGNYLSGATSTSIAYTSGWGNDGTLRLASLYGGKYSWRVATGTSADNVTVTFGSSYQGGASNGGRHRHVVVFVFSNTSSTSLSVIETTGASSPSSFNVPTGTPTVDALNVLTVVSATNINATTRNGWYSPLLSTSVTAAYGVSAAPVHAGTASPISPVLNWTSTAPFSSPYWTSFQLLGDLDPPSPAGRGGGWSLGMTAG